MAYFPKPTMMQIGVALLVPASAAALFSYPEHETGTADAPDIPVNAAHATTTLDPYAAPSSWYVLPGASVTFSASGFAPHEALEISGGTLRSAIRTAETNEAGLISGAGKLTIPYTAPAGRQTFRIKGMESDAATDVTIEIGTYEPWVTASNYFVGPGETLTLRGYGFAPGEPVAITIESEQDERYTVADHAGAITAEGLRIPPLVASHTAAVMAQGAFSRAAASLTILAAPE